jgi:hypothetical protein
VKQALGSCGLVACDPDEKAELPQLLQAGAGVRIQVVLIEVLGKSACSRRSRSTARSNPGRKCWKVCRLVVAAGDDRAEHGGEVCRGTPSQSAQVPYSVVLSISSPASLAMWVATGSFSPAPLGAGAAPLARSC